MDAGWIILGGVIVVMAAILVYVVLMIFWPEWVGITGRTALEAERSHADDSTFKTEAKPDVTSVTSATSEKSDF